MNSNINLTLIAAALLTCMPAAALTAGNPDSVKFSLVADPVPAQAITGSNPAKQFYHAQYAGSAWGDYDADGRLDLFYSDINPMVSDATVFVNLYRNAPTNTFTRQNRTPFSGTAFSCPVWFDANADTKLDLLLPGVSSYSYQWNDTATVLSQLQAHLYLNTGSNKLHANFSEATESGLRPLFNGKSGGHGHNWATTGDFDKDGHADVLMQGFDENLRFSSSQPEEAARAVYLYRNLGDGQHFALVSNPVQGDTTFAGLTDGSVVLEDMDGDGWLDILATGYGHTRTSECHLYWNEGDGTFTESRQHFAALCNSSCYARDLNNDGLPDLVLTGIYDNTGTKTFAIYRNLGQRQFELIDSLGLEGIDGGQIAFGDVNNDGLVDMLVGGHGATHQHTTWLYVNQGDFHFTATGTWYDDPFGKLGHFGRVTHGSQQLIDYDLDGYLDAWISGWDSGDCSKGCATLLYHNDSQKHSVQPNAAPKVPSGLNASFDAHTGMVTLTWNAPDDDTTPQAGLRYNVYLKRAGQSDSCFMVIPADTATGFIRVGTIGGAINQCTYQTRISVSGNYEWGVQAIDNGNLGSKFATGSFTCKSDGLTSAEIDSQSIWANGFTLHYNVSSLSRISIFNAMGAALVQQQVNGCGSLRLPEDQHFVIALLSGPQGPKSLKISY